VTQILNLSKLPFASFNNVEFFYQSGSTVGGRKTVTHEFPDANTRYVEDLGKSEKKFTVNAIIDTNPGNRQRDALIRELDSDTVGILIHPKYGRQEVKALNYNITDDITELGVARFNITFEKAERNQFPVRARSSSGFVDRLKKAVTDALDNNFPNAWSSVKNNIEAFNNIRAATERTGREIKRASQVIEGSTDGVAAFVTSINEVIDNAGGLVQSPSVLAEKLRTSFDNLEVAYNSSRDVFTVLTGLFGFDTASQEQAIGSSTTSNIINTNQSELNLFTNVSAIAAAYDAAIGIEFNNLDDLNSVKDQLEAGFNTVDSRTNRDVYQNLLDLRVQANAVLDNLSISLSKVIDFKTNPISLNVLTYNLYGSLDRKSELLSLNSIRDSSRVSGDLRILSNG
jgi:prophage DNA circulation protein